MNRILPQVILLIIFFNTSFLFSQLKVLTTFVGETSTEKEINQDEIPSKRQDYSQNIILFKIRKIIMTTTYGDYGEQLNRLDLDGMTLISVEEVPKYRYMEQRIEFARSFDELMPKIDNGGSTQKTKSKLEIEYERVNMHEIVYKCLVKIPGANQDGYTFYLDDKYEKMAY